MIKVTFPDGSVHEFEKGVKILDVAISISEGFARNVIGAVVNDDIIKGLSETLKEDCTVKFVKFEGKRNFLAYIKSRYGSCYSKTIS